MLLYLHVPFCRRKCHYCAFHSCIPGQGDVARYVDLVCKEAALWGKRLNRPEISTIYFGGGTPSLLPLPALVKIVSAIEQHFSATDNLEFTLEANPDSVVDWTYLHGLLAVGVNRLSIGVQSLYDNYLQTLGRPHNADQARAACRLARDAGFTNISLDLIWGLPKERLYTWMSQLREIVRMAPDHLSCYGLTLEPGTHLEKMSHSVEMDFASQDDQAKMYIYGAEYLESQGYLQYEISNFAKMGFMSRHNSGYWEGHDYLGLGPSAVSTIGDKRWENPSDHGAYAQLVESAGMGRDAEFLDTTTRIKEMIMLRLRTNRGIRLAAYKALTGRSFMQDFGPLLTALRQNELIRIRGGYLRLSRTGMLVSDTILANLFDSGPLADSPSSAEEEPDTSQDD